MAKATFKNDLYYWAVVLYLSGLFIWNLTITIATGRLIGLLPLAVGSIMIFLFATKNKYSRIAIMIWSMIFLIVASGLQLLGRLMTDTVNNFVEFDVVYYIKNIVSIILGLLIFVYGKNTIEIIPDKSE